MNISRYGQHCASSGWEMKMSLHMSTRGNPRTAMSMLHGQSDGHTTSCAFLWTSCTRTDPFKGECAITSFVRVLHYVPVLPSLYEKLHAFVIHAFDIHAFCYVRSAAPCPRPQLDPSLTSMLQLVYEQCYAPDIRGMNVKADSRLSFVLQVLGSWGCGMDTLFCPYQSIYLSINQSINQSITSISMLQHITWAIYAAYAAQLSCHCWRLASALQILGAWGCSKDALLCLHLYAALVRVPRMVASRSRA